MVGLPLVERHSLASYLLQLAQVDGVVTDDEVRVLRAVHELLDLNPDEVEHRLRPRAVPPAPATPAELFTLQPADAETESIEPALLVLAPAEPLIAPDEKPERLVQVDEERLSATQANNEMVRTLLTAIFDEDEDEDEPVPDERPFRGSRRRRHPRRRAFGLTARSRPARPHQPS